MSNWQNHFLLENKMSKTPKSKQLLGYNLSFVLFSPCVKFSNFCLNFVKNGKVLPLQQQNYCWKDLCHFSWSAVLTLPQLLILHERDNSMRPGPNICPSFTILGLFIEIPWLVGFNNLLYQCDTFLASMNIFQESGCLKGNLDSTHWHLGKPVLI